MTYFSGSEIFNLCPKFAGFIGRLSPNVESWFLQGLLEPTLQVLQLDGNPLRRYTVFSIFLPYQ